MKGFGLWRNNKNQAATDSAAAANQKQQQPQQRKGLFSGLTSAFSGSAASGSQQAKPTMGIATSTGFIPQQRQLSTTTLNDTEDNDNKEKAIESSKQSEVAGKNGTPSGEDSEAASSILPAPPKASVADAQLTTTAGGDGLSFMAGQPNIFDIIQALKEGRDLLEGPKEDDHQEEGNSSDVTRTEDTEEHEEEDTSHQAVPFNDYELLSLEELPQELKPISNLIEMVHYLEKMKLEWRPQSEAEAEFLQVLRQIKSSDKIFTCSHTLQLLTERYTQLSEDNDWLSTRVDQLENENFRLKQELGSQRIVSQYL